ncbi:Zinc carboxypeptidase family protein [Brugia malayi]|uniref:Zinc carboxypeptidase family protein n=1 Tax=Brugia malayi TaxID=6279 RepID=A0A4E9FJB0_BRUMA|nr:Zinc carboxypeptidase family protein [Brugia malayi]VIO97025.1 Zinc carboxypeptidase family protein [Brugia malayi]
MDVLKWLRNNAVEYELDIWKETSGLGNFMDIMVPPNMIAIIEELFRKEGIEYIITIPDVRNLIERNEIYPRGANNITRTAKQHDTLLESFFARLKDDPILDEKADESEESLRKVSKLNVKYPFGDYGSYNDMLKYMRTIEFYYPHITKLVRIGETHEGAPIEGLKIGYPIRDINKRAFWIDANIHAREWASSHTALYFINQLVSGFEKDPVITRYIRSINIYIFPCLNPDGYEYTRSKPNPQVRLWRKNRSPQKCIRSPWGGRRCCAGVDLNRNFDFHWAEVGSSENPCSYLYQGESAFSEPETRAVRDFLLSPEMQGKLDGFITLHTYAQLWIHPYSHKEESFPDNYAQLKRTAKRAVSRLKKVYGTQYRIGTGADILAPASGGSDDWAKNALGVKFVYLIELRPQLELLNGFILNKDELIPTAVETWEGVRTVIDDAIRANDLLNLKSIASESLSALGQFMKHKLPINRGDKIQQTNGISRILAGIKITPELPALKVRSRSLGSTIYFHNDTIGLIQSNITNQTDHITTKSISNRNDSLIANMVKPFKIIHSNYETVITNQIKLSNQTSLTTLSSLSLSPSLSPVTLHPTSSLAINHFNNSSRRQFLNSNCKDIRNSCKFWLRTNPNICTEQYELMKIQCMYTCEYCAHLDN